MTKANWMQSSTPPGSMLALMLVQTLAGPIAAAQSTTPSVLPVETATLQHEDAYSVVRLFTGRVEAQRESPLGFESAGLLAEVLVREGDTVEREQLIAVLDNARLKAQRDELVAAREEAEARLALADATLKRTRGIVEQGGVSRQELDEASEGQRAASAALRLAERRLSTIDVELDKQHLRAPFDGVITLRSADEGRVVEAGQPIVTLQERSRPEIRVGLAGRALEQLEVGQEHTIEWHGRTLRAHLRALLPLREARARTVTALFDPLEDVALLPGDVVTLRIATRVVEPGLWLPVAALTEGERGLWSVLVAEPLPGLDTAANGTHRVKRYTVDVLHQAGERVYVRSSLAPQDEIILGGLQRVVPGQIVRTGQALAAADGQAHGQ